MKKTKSKRNNLIITDRDMEIFNALTKYHLTGKMVFELSQTFADPFTSVENTRARLSLLHQKNFLKRDSRFVKGRGKNENYYFLTRKSAGLFEEYRRLNHKDVILQPVGLAKQPHSFLISKIMVKMELDAHYFRDICQLVGFIRENCFKVKGEGSRLVKPDGAIFLNINGQNHLLFLEADLSTVILRSNKPYARTFENKIKIYSEFKNRFWQEETIHSLPGIQGYRVITVCKSVQRLQNLLGLAKEMNKSGMFWFTTEEWLLDKNRNCLFDKVWALPNRQFYPLF